MLNRRETAIRTLFNQTRGKGFNSIRVFMAGSHQEILDRMLDIAVQSSQIPTIYSPPRQEDNEYTFGINTSYFDALVKMRKKDVKDVLRSWIDPSSPTNLKFLASDLIGIYKLEDLLLDLKHQADALFPQWKDITNEELDKQKEYSWILNYIRAFSRCKDNYRTLGDILCGSGNAWIENWILHIPLQVPDDMGLCQMIGTYLKRNFTIEARNLEKAANALAALHRAGHGEAEKILMAPLGNLRVVQGPISTNHKGLNCF